MLQCAPTSLELPAPSEVDPGQPQRAGKEAIRNVFCAILLVRRVVDLPQAWPSAARAQERHRAHDPVREERIAKVDVPCYVVFDMESYSLGYSNAAVF
jgi:hypothetical protein